MNEGLQTCKRCGKGIAASDSRWKLMCGMCERDVRAEKEKGKPFYPTTQEESIKAFFEYSKVTFTARDFAKDCKLVLATVYRRLHLFQRLGWVEPVTVRYDGRQSATVWRKTIQVIKKGE